MYFEGGKGRQDDHISLLNSGCITGHLGLPHLFLM